MQPAPWGAAVARGGYRGWGSPKTHAANTAMRMAATQAIQAQGTPGRCQTPPPHVAAHHTAGPMGAAVVRGG